MATEPTVIGIDVGTSGVRTVAVNPDGTIRAHAERPLDALPRSDDGVHEQSPEHWWNVVRETSHEVVESLRQSGAYAPVGIAVTSTSGTLVVTDGVGNPLRHALMYDDNRAAAVSERLNRAAGENVWNSSHSLTKAIWIEQAEPQTWERVCHLLHPADWIAGRLCGEYGFSDVSNSLKLGYEPERAEWSETLERMGVPGTRLPRVLRPGEQAGVVSKAAASETGFSAGTPVIAGATDGIAGLIACGAHSPGDASSSLGTTLVWKVLSVRRPSFHSAIYCHLHPAGLWAPGAASNTGPGSLARDLTLSHAEADRAAAGCLPTQVLSYPLRGRGERFPFMDPDATSFVEGTPAGPEELYASQLQAIAFVERWGYEVLERCRVEVGQVVFSAGSAARSPMLSQLRANVLGRTVVRCCHPTAVFGAAILAAAGVYHEGDVALSIRSMTGIAESFSPSPSATAEYQRIYESFLQACTRRGYVS